MRDENLTDTEGWPCAFPESTICSALLAAIDDLPGADELTDVSRLGAASFLYIAAVQGRQEEEPQNRPASFKATLKQVDELAKAAEKLCEKVEALNAPAVQALVEEGVEPTQFRRVSDELRQLAQGALQARDNINAPETAKGRPTEVEANDVAEEAGRIFLEVTGQRPTLTNVVATGAVQGTWPDFLERVFRALFIKGSAASQADRVCKIYRPK